MDNVSLISNNIPVQQAAKCFGLVEIELVKILLEDKATVDYFGFLNQIPYDLSIEIMVNLYRDYMEKHLQNKAFKELISSWDDKKILSFLVIANYHIVGQALENYSPKEEK